MKITNISVSGNVGNGDNIIYGEVFPDLRDAYQEGYLPRSGEEELYALHLSEDGNAVVVATIYGKDEPGRDAYIAFAVQFPTKQKVDGAALRALMHQLAKGRDKYLANERLIQNFDWAGFIDRAIKEASNIELSELKEAQYPTSLGTIARVDVGDELEKYLSLPIQEDYKKYDLILFSTGKSAQAYPSDSDSGIVTIPLTLKEQPITITWSGTSLYTIEPQATEVTEKELKETMVTVSKPYHKAKDVNLSNIVKEDGYLHYIYNTDLEIVLTPETKSITFKVEDAGGSQDDKATITLTIESTTDSDAKEITLPIEHKTNSATIKFTGYEIGKTYKYTCAKAGFKEKKGTFIPEKENESLKITLEKEPPKPTQSDTGQGGVKDVSTSNNQQNTNNSNSTTYTYHISKDIENLSELKIDYNNNPVTLQQGLNIVIEKDDSGYYFTYEYALPSSFKVSYKGKQCTITQRGEFPVFDILISESGSKKKLKWIPFVAGGVVVAALIVVAIVTKGFGLWKDRQGSGGNDSTTDTTSTTTGIDNMELNDRRDALNKRINGYLDGNEWYLATMKSYRDTACSINDTLKSSKSDTIDLTCLDANIYLRECFDNANNLGFRTADGKTAVDGMKDTIKIQNLSKDKQEIWKKGLEEMPNADGKTTRSALKIGMNITKTKKRPDFTWEDIRKDIEKFYTKSNLKANNKPTTSTSTSSSIYAAQPGGGGASTDKDAAPLQQPVKCKCLGGHAIKGTLFEYIKSITNLENINGIDTCEIHKDVAQYVKNLKDLNKGSYKQFSDDYDFYYEKVNNKEKKSRPSEKGGKQQIWDCLEKIKELNK